jgi:hypothetical protein
VPREKLKLAGRAARVLCPLALLCAAALPADAPLEPLSVCEVLHDLPAHEGKRVTVFGRYSFRTTGRWLGEQACAPPVDGPAQFSLVEDANGAPRPPADFEIDGAAVRHKFTDMVKRTSLGKFRFGTPDYDRWAVIYGRVEQRKGDDAKKALANLVIRGSGVIVYVSPEE